MASTTTSTTTTGTTTTVEVLDTQIAIEVLETDTDPELWDTQVAVEVMETDTDPELWDTQIAVEVLEKVPNTSTSTTSTTTTEDPDQIGDWFTDFREYKADRVPSDWSQGESPDYQVGMIRALAGAVGGKILQLHSELIGGIATRTFTWDTVPSSDGTVEVVAKIKGIELASTGKIAALVVRDDPAGDARYLFHLNNITNKIVLSYGNWTEITNVAAGLSLSDDTWYRFRVRIVEQEDNVWCRARVWLDGSGEPGTWALDYHDGDQRQTGAGRVGIAGRTKGNNSQLDWISVALGGASAKIPTELPTTTTSTTTTETTTSHTTTTAGHEYITDFNSYPVASPPSDWTETYGGAYASMNIQTNGHIGPLNKNLRVLHSAQGLCANTWDVVPNVRNVDVLTRVMPKAGTSFEPGVILRADASGDAYAVHISTLTNDLYLDRYTAGVWAGLAQRDAGITISMDTWYWMRAKITTLKTPYGAVRVQIKFWAAGSAEPATWRVDVAVRGAAEFYGAGLVGVSGYGSADDFYVDYFHVSTGGLEGYWGSTTSTTTTHEWDETFADMPVGNPPVGWTETWDTANVDTSVEKAGMDRSLLLDKTSNVKIAVTHDPINHDDIRNRVHALFRPG
jgi:hypothetical protein